MRPSSSYNGKKSRIESKMAIQGYLFLDHWKASKGLYIAM